MNKEALKLVLQSFHAGMDDESDPVFREAFEQMSQDPELAAWFCAEQEFDAVMVEKFRNVPVEESAKTRLLARARQSK
ncbi:MAG: hypothetical protein M3Z64_08520 [Verrucomicrobiota bacterium]|nr:hypothetical protein [Verrucomicrobiota bacterium]